MSTKKETKRDVIIEAAFALFLEKGYLSTKIVDIANAAGIGKGTVYEYFDSKEALLLEILNSKVEQGYKSVNDAISGLGSARDKLAAYLEFQRESTKRYRANVFDLRQDLLRVDEASSREIMHSIHNIIMSQFCTVQQILEEGMDSGELRQINSTMAANGILSVINSFVVFKYAGLMTPCEADAIHTRFPTDLESWSEEALLDMIFNGLTAEQQ